MGDSTSNNTQQQIPCDPLLDNLVSLKQVSLQALSSIVKSIVKEDSGPEIEIANEISFLDRVTDEISSSSTSATDISLEKLRTDIQNVSATLVTIQHQRSISRDNALSLNENNQVAIALAALCNSLYQIIETNVDANVTLDSGAIIPRIQEVQQQRPMEQTTVDQRELWSEMDTLMLAIQGMCERRQRPPSYSENIITDDLENVIAAIDRVISTAPRHHSQDVFLTEIQSQKFNATELVKLVDRLIKNAKDFDDQRANLNPNCKYARLNSLVTLISSTHKSLENQRAILSPCNIEKLEIGKITRVIDQQYKRRYFNQDWVSREQQLINDLEILGRDLIKIPRLDNQRADMSLENSQKLQLGAMFGKLESACQRRLSNQDSTSIRDRRFDDIERLLGSLGPRMSDQDCRLKKVAI